MGVERHNLIGLEHYMRHLFTTMVGTSFETMENAFPGFTCIPREKEGAEEVQLMRGFFFFSFPPVDRENSEREGIWGMGVEL